MNGYLKIALGVIGAIIATVSTASIFGVINLARAQTATDTQVAEVKEELERRRPAVDSVRVVAKQVERIEKDIEKLDAKIDSNQEKLDEKIDKNQAELIRVIQASK